MDAQYRHPLASDEALRLIDGHCRFVCSRLPHGVVAGRTAQAYLSRLVEGCRRGVPDLFGTPTRSVTRAAEYGLLAEAPCGKVAGALVKLIAALSPVIESRGARSCTLWVTHLLDEEMQRELRSATPTSFQLVTPFPQVERVYTSRARKDALRELEESRDALEIELRREKALRGEDRIEQQMLLLQVEALTAVNSELELHVEELRRIIATQKETQEIIRRKVDEVERRMAHLTEENGELKGWLAEATRSQPTSDGPAGPTGEPSAKVGRNAPCPCGSGRKYKRCCGA